MDMLIWHKNVGCMQMYLLGKVGQVVNEKMMLASYSLEIIWVLQKELVHPYLYTWGSSCSVEKETRLLVA